MDVLSSQSRPQPSLIPRRRTGFRRIPAGIRFCEVWLLRSDHGKGLGLAEVRRLLYICSG